MNITTTENMKYLNKQVHCFECLPLLSSNSNSWDDVILSSRIPPRVNLCSCQEMRRSALSGSITLAVRRAWCLWWTAPVTRLPWRQRARSCIKPRRTRSWRVCPYWCWQTAKTSRRLETPTRSVLQSLHPLIPLYMIVCLAATDKPKTDTVTRALPTPCNAPVYVSNGCHRQTKARD